jgi:prephenate dehydratase
VRGGSADYAVVAIENSVEGGVTAVLDTLATGSPLVIQREMLVPVSFTLAALGPVPAADIRRIAAHPHAWAQCRYWLNEHLPKAVHVAATSNTAPAAQIAAWREAHDGGRDGGAKGGQPSSSVLSQAAKELGFDAALVPPAAIGRYGLTPLQESVADNQSAVTRFVLIGKPGPVPPATGADKTTLVVHLPAERSGALLELLEQFATRGINLCRIESRPSGVALGRYSFSIDVEGHIAEERVAEAMVGLHRFSPLVRFLGSYPKADGVRTEVAAGNRDPDFQSGKAWVYAVKAGESV